MKLKIKITQEVLNATKMCGTKGFMLKGSKYEGSASNCAITYACRKLFPNCLTSNKIYMREDESHRSHIKVIVANLPASAKDFIFRFDDATPEERVQMKPFEFEVELTKEALDLITIDKITKVLETSTTLEIA